MYHKETLKECHQKKQLVYEKAGSTSQNSTVEYDKSVYHKDRFVFQSRLLSEDQVDHINQKVKLRIPSTIANISSLIPSIYFSQKCIITASIERKSKELCKKKNGSVLYGTLFEDMNNFSIEAIWNELKVLSRVKNHNCYSIDPGVDNDIQSESSILYEGIVS
ncbi:uncharacterized protein LOC130641914 [Hydractinia symbiolongicarpus]|uniref:uncharacterized protein LOC130641914 n=1 Tax=Hydractinia symbiolongicarpus TaxID=13093 RepID=UPI00254EF174|nr:uncharacterized protein LOC130641914 [Hydractinia symbiolongicarpus]